jgi:hypothetical protein
MPVTNQTSPESTLLDPHKVVLFSPDRWKDLTYGGLTTRRSGELKKLDESIALCHGALKANSLNLAQIQSLKRSLEEWKANKLDWKDSRRNNNRTVELLDVYITQALSHPDYTYPVEMLNENPGHAEALSMMQDMKLQFRSVAQTFVAIEKKNDDRKAYDLKKNEFIKTAWQQGKDRFNAAKRGAKAADLLAKQLADRIGRASGGKIQAVSALTAAKGMAMPDSLAHAMTVAGDQVDDFKKLIGAQAATHFDSAFDNWYQRRMVNQARRFVNEGDPEAAVDALNELLSRDMRAELKRGCVEGFVSGLKAAEAALDLSAAAGALAATGLSAGAAAPVAAIVSYGVAKILNEGTKVVKDKMMDYFVEGAIAKLVQQEIEAGSIIIRNKEFDSKMFDKCPLFGAYFLLNGGGLPTNALIYWGKPAFGTPAFQSYIEQASRKVGVLRETALMQTKKSPIWVKRVGNVVLIPVEGSDAMDYEERLAEERKVNAEARAKISMLLAQIDQQELLAMPGKMNKVDKPDDSLKPWVKEQYKSNQAVENYHGQRFRPDLPLWRGTLVTKSNLGTIAAKDGVTQASHYQVGGADLRALRSGLPFGALLTLENWKEFSSVGFFSKQKPRFLFSRRTKETKQLDLAFTQFEADYGNSIWKSGEIGGRISTASDKKAPRGSYDGLPHDQTGRGVNLESEKAIRGGINKEKYALRDIMIVGQDALNIRLEALHKLIGAVDQWLTVKQKTGTSTRTASIVFLRNLLNVESDALSEEIKRLGPAGLP